MRVQDLLEVLNYNNSDKLWLNEGGRLRATSYKTLKQIYGGERVKLISCDKRGQLTFTIE